MWAHIFALCAGAITNRATVETHRGWVGSRDSLLSDTLWQTTSKQSTQSMCCVYQLSKRLHVIKRVLIFRAGAAAQPHQGALAAHMHSRRRSVPACNRFESNSLARSNAALPAASRARFAVGDLPISSVSAPQLQQLVHEKAGSAPTHPVPLNLSSHPARAEVRTCTTKLPTKEVRFFKFNEGEDFYPRKVK